METGESNATGGQRLTESPGGEDAHDEDAVDAGKRIDEDAAEAQARAKWDRAYAYLAANEGGWSDHPADRGGATKYGISSAAYPREDIKNLTRERAKFLFQRDYWIKPGFDEIEPERVAVKVFDFGVVAGPYRSAIRLQRALNQLGAEPLLAVDGKVGPKTLAACREMACRHGEGAVLAKLVEIQAAYFDAIDDGSQAVFARGWQNRAKRLPDEIQAA